MTTKIQVSLSQAFYNKDMRPNGVGDVRSRSFIATDSSLKVFISHLRTGNAFAVATYQDNHRNEDNFIQSQIVALDLDSNSMQVAQQKPDIAKHALILHETPSHTFDKPKARVIFVLDKPIPRLAAWRKAQAAVLHHFAELKPDTSCHDGARFFYGSTGDYIIQAGNRLPIDILAEWIKEHEAHEAAQLEVGPGGSAQVDKQDKASKYAEKAYQDDLAQLKATTDHRNNKLFAVTCNLLSMARGAWPGITEDRVTNDCKQIGIAIGLTQKEVAATIKSAEKKATGRMFPQLNQVSKQEEKDFIRFANEQSQQQTAPSRQSQPPPPAAKVSSPVNGKPTPLLELSTITMEDVQKKFNAALRNPNMVPGFKTDIKQFNLMTGGLQRGYVHTLIGETGSQKTQLSMGVAYAVMQQTPILILSMESNAEQIMNRMVAYACGRDGVSYGDFYKGKKLVHIPGGEVYSEHYTEADLFSIHKAQSSIAKLQKHGHLSIIKKPGTAKLEDLRIAIGKWVKEKGIGLIIWDGFGDIIIPGVSIYNRTVETMAMVELIAQENDVAIWGTTQGGRNTKGRGDKKLGSADSFGGSAIEQKSAIHLSIYDPWLLCQQELINRSDIDEEKCPQGQAILRLNKLRDGSLMNNSMSVRKIGGAGFYEVVNLEKNGR